MSATTLHESHAVKPITDNLVQELQDRIRLVIEEYLPNASGYMLAVVEPESEELDAAHVFKNIEDGHCLALITSLGKSLVAEMVNQQPRNDRNDH